MTRNIGSQGVAAGQFEKNEPAALWGRKVDQLLVQTLNAGRLTNPDKTNVRVHNFVLRPRKPGG